MATVQWQAPHLNIEYSVGHGGMGAGAFEARSRLFLRCFGAGKTNKKTNTAASLALYTRCRRRRSRPCTRRPLYRPPPVPTAPIVHPAQLRGTVAVLAGVVPPDPLANIPSKNGL